MSEPKGIFRKPIKIKSNTALKGSGKKKLMKQILDMYPKLEEHIEGLFPKKDNVSEVKIFTNEGPSMVYTVQNVPLFFELNNKIYPSVFLLWKHPRLVASVSTHDAVIERLVNGADFMVPGLKNSEYDGFKKGETVSVCSGNNLASLAVGIAALDSSKIASEQSGKALFIIHTIQDELFKMASHPPEKPVITETSEEPKDNPIEAEIEETEEKIEDLEIEEVEEDIDYDFLLKKYFLISLLNLPKGSLPILCNVFYKNKVLDEIPEDIEFDIKKTSYKKLSVFIKKLVDEKLITIEDAKGVQKLLTVNFTHPEFAEVKQFKQNLETQKKSQIKIVEMYRVTSAGLRILELHNYRKGDILSAEQVRSCLNEYNSKKLDPSTNPDCVLLNDTMASVINVKYREIKYKTLFQLFFKILGKTYIIKLPSGEELIKNTLSSIQIKVASRCNNKKVTMISNLSNFGIDIKDFAHDCQLMAAASATINETPGQPNVLQFQIQGNHANMMRKILIEKYGVPMRYIVGGLEKEKKKPK